jgi:hypothetical protein
MSFQRALPEEAQHLDSLMELGGVVLPPLVVKKEDTQLVDGYCPYTTFKAMNVSRVYAHSGIL